MPLYRISFLVALCLLTNEFVLSEDASPYDSGLVDELVSSALANGNAARGTVIYASPTSACLSCHQVGAHGGKVGPDLSMIGSKEKPAHLVESLLWPKRKIKDEYKAVAVLTSSGNILRGYVAAETDQHLKLRDSADATVHTIAQDDIEEVQELGSLMPEGLTATLSDQDKLDLIAFLADLGKHEKISIESIDGLLKHAHGHHPATFDMPREPLDPGRWPSWQAHVNRDRIYDFYAKQAIHFRDVQPRPNLLAEYPGLDGGSYGHWGNQSEPVWADDKWNETDLGSMLSGVFRGPKITITRGVCIQLCEGKETISTCFDTDTLEYKRVWSGGFVGFSSVRHGFMHGLNQQGETVKIPAFKPPYKKGAVKKYLGYYRHGRRVIFSYRVGGTEYLDSASIVEGKFTRTVAARSEHPDRTLLQGGKPQWPQEFVTQGKLGSTTPYTVDKIKLPTNNPWKALIYVGGHDFLSDGTAVLCTMQGDVWRVRGLDDGLKSVRWRRIASGLHQPLGLVVHDDQIFVIGRNQLTQLHDLNGDGESDFYECVSNAPITSRSGHDFTCGLERDSEGRFYTVSGKEGVLRISSDGQTTEVLASGLRNSDGIGRYPDGMLTIPSSEGDWMPASMIAAVRPDGAVLNRLPGKTPDDRGLPFFGRPGTNRDGTVRKQPPEIPMLYLPRGIDNSSGGQTYISDDRWGPVAGNMVHTSYGAGTAFLLLRDEFDDWVQGAVAPLNVEFTSGSHRAKFNPVDGQLYVGGMGGWGTYTSERGGFDRVRYTESAIAKETKSILPTGFHVHENGVRVTFSQPLDRSVVEQANRHFAQAWNYRYSGAYGSPEYSARQLDLRGHDVMTIQSATVLQDPKSLFLEIQDLQPVNQLHLLIQTSSQSHQELFMTVNRLDKPMTQLADYRASEKPVLPHPMLNDLARPMVIKRNRNVKAIPDARPITVSAAKNLQFDQSEIRVKAGEPIRLTFKNPDAVPHNWALLKPGSLKEIGEQTNKLIADPKAAANHYIPDSDKVLTYTDVVGPHSEFTIYFNAPEEPERYPYLCTFPGHWMVMNGNLLVE
jgi:putative heme-binding domain-containing protein